MYMYGYIYNSDSGHDGIKKMIKVYEIEKKVKKKYIICATIRRVIDMQYYNY